MTDDVETLDRAAVARTLIIWVGELVPRDEGAPIAEETRFSQLSGFDSIALVQLLARAEEEFDLELADQDETIRRAESVGSLAECIVAEKVRQRG